MNLEKLEKATARTQYKQHTHTHTLTNIYIIWDFELSFPSTEPKDQDLNNRDPENINKHTHTLIQSTYQ